MQRKEDKAGHKTANKEDRQRKKRAREKIEIDSEKKFNFWLVGMREKKAVYLRPSSGKICFFCCILMLNSRKPVQRRGTGEK